MNIEKLNDALDNVRECLGLPDDLPIENCKEPEYAGGRACILRALVSAKLVSKDDATIWAYNYTG